MNPSAQYIAGISKGDLHRYRLTRANGDGDGRYTVRCVSGPCIGYAARLTAVTVPKINGTVTLIPASGAKANTANAANATIQHQQDCSSLAGGRWCLGQGCGEQYAVTEKKMGSGKTLVNVSCVNGPGSPCTSWQRATGVLNIAKQTLEVSFNTGGGQTGTVASDCSRVYWCAHPAGCSNFWCEKGECRRPAPPSPPLGPRMGVVSIKDDCHAIFFADQQGTDGGTGGGDAWYREVANSPQKVTVHIVPHSHLDPGWLCKSFVMPHTSHVTPLQTV